MYKKRTGNAEAVCFARLFLDADNIFTDILFLKKITVV
jgi:hypothetical protein